LQAPLFFSLKDGAAGESGGVIVQAKNKNTFASSAGLLLSWRVLLDGVPLLVGDPAQRDIAGWYPGGSVAIAPQVAPAGHTCQSAHLHAPWNPEMGCSVLKVSC
jgi:hypothetical protein